MKIAHLTPSVTRFPPRGDQGRYRLVNLLIEGLSAKKHKVTLYAHKDSTTSAELISIDSLPLEGRSRIEKLKNVTLSTNLLISRAYQDAKKYDVIHSHFNDKHLMFNALVDVPTVVTQHWPITEEMDHILSQANLKNLHIVPISKAQKKANPKLPYTQVVYNGIEVDKFKFRPESGKYLANLSRVMPEKGTRDAIKVANKAKLPLVIAGKSKHSDKARAYWPEVEKALIKSAYAKYRGMIPHKEVSNFLGHAKALIFPIKWEEPFGLVMIEAMATGTPVIAYGRGSVPEIVKDGVTGFIVNSVREMAKAVKKIDQIDRAACRKHVEDNFSVQQMVEGYEKVYKSLKKK
ncbi:glycosyltransferase family 4 protein [Patescibacteria group bacterium]